jgi:hypothetical protein
MLNLVSDIVQYSILAIGIMFFALELVWYVARSYATNTTTAMHEVARLGKAHALGCINGTAVVAGGR